MSTMKSSITYPIQKQAKAICKGERIDMHEEVSLGQIPQRFGLIIDALNNIFCNEEASSRVTPSPEQMFVEENTRL